MPLLSGVPPDYVFCEASRVAVRRKRAQQRQCNRRISSVGLMVKPSWASSALNCTCSTRRQARSRVAMSSWCVTSSDSRRRGGGRPQRSIAPGSARATDRYFLEPHELSPLAPHELPSFAPQEETPSSPAFALQLLQLDVAQPLVITPTPATRPATVRHFNASFMFSLVMSYGFLSFVALHLHQPINSLLLFSGYL